MQDIQYPALKCSNCFAKKEAVPMFGYKQTAECMSVLLKQVKCHRL